MESTWLMEVVSRQCTIQVPRRETSNLAQDHPTANNHVASQIKINPERSKMFTTSMVQTDHPLKGNKRLSGSLSQVDLECAPSIENT